MAARKEWIGCAAGNFGKGRPTGFVPEAIVIHIIDGSLHRADLHFNDPASFVSAHYAVGRDGTIHQFVEEGDTAFHAGVVVNPTWPLLKPGVNPNFYTIGIEHEGRPGDPWSEALYGSSAALVSEVAARWNIPLTVDHVIHHHQIRATKSCPGTKADIGQLLQRARNLRSGSEGLPPGFHVPERLDVRVLMDCNLRLAPNSAARIARVMPAGTAVTVRAFVDWGERVRGNGYWYVDAQGNCFWAGATDVPEPTG
ncbi:MAG TPA: peptidoglycan recognition family protein [Candidatus Methylomirabilis sp.]|nr:peptidoglycan recognition family protein [Candidatus Methylomirabilis sp.]